MVSAHLFFTTQPKQGVPTAAMSATLSEIMFRTAGVFSCSQHQYRRLQPTTVYIGSRHPGLEYEFFDGLGHTVFLSLGNEVGSGAHFLHG